MEIFLAILGALGLIATYSVWVWNMGFTDGVKACQKHHEIIRYDLTK